MRPTSILCALLLAVAPAIAQKSRSHRRSSKPVASQPSTHDCGHSLTLQLSSPDPTQGSLLLLELRSATQPVSEIKATWDKREIPFWQQPKTNEKSPNVWHALLGVDLELKPENYPLTLTAKTESAEPIPCTATIDVKEGKFATESLKVAPNFVEPNPEQLARSEAERQRLRAIFATITPDRLWDGSFHYPLTGITTGGNFGKRRILNGKAGSPHGGVDFPAPAGTPVYAAQRGRVVLAEPLYFSGNTVILDHGLGLYTFYAHFESISVQAGDLVDTGALLGKVGATGRVTGPHLHWAATVNRARTNPIQLISLLGEKAPS
ncbi:MAG: zinc metalloendopeptidase [Bryobacterales bacterium]|nr:zinc metalloendopeptidase [Bryobacterales bacterium]